MELITDLVDFRTVFIKKESFRFNEKLVSHRKQKKIGDDNFSNKCLICDRRAISSLNVNTTNTTNNKYLYKPPRQIRSRTD